ncbi:arsenic metallochaperone ArsD family protein [Enterococcus silesiacus]|nr:arsenic metallochaperone ArsD family protein [Enterococcus silesiacus]
MRQTRFARGVINLMIKIEYFILNKNFSNNIDFDIFESINSSKFKENYFYLKGKSLETEIIFLDESKKLLLKNKVVQKYYDKNDASVFPLVFLNDRVIKQGSFLSSDELSDILDIGLSIQQNPE